MTGDSVALVNVGDRIDAARKRLGLLGDPARQTNDAGDEALIRQLPAQFAFGGFSHVKNQSRIAPILYNAKVEKLGITCRYDEFYNHILVEGFAVAEFGGAPTDD